MKKFFALCLILTVFAFKSEIKAQSAKAGSVADVQFIKGQWKATQPDGRTIEGSWLAPVGENMVGMMRMMKDGKVTMYEMLAYENSDQGFVSLVKHFKPGLTGHEEKDKQDRYKFLEASKDKAYFEKEGEALRILYEKRSENQFVIARGNQENGKWVYKDLFVFNQVK